MTTDPAPARPLRPGDIDPLCMDNPRAEEGCPSVGGAPVGAMPYMCTRDEEHPAPHVACTYGNVVVATWEDQPSG